MNKHSSIDLYGRTHASFTENMSTLQPNITKYVSQNALWEIGTGIGIEQEELELIKETNSAFGMRDVLARDKVDFARFCGWHPFCKVSKKYVIFLYFLEHNHFISFFLFYFLPSSNMWNEDLYNTLCVSEKTS